MYYILNYMLTCTYVTSAVLYLDVFVSGFKIPNS